MGDYERYAVPQLPVNALAGRFLNLKVFIEEKGADIGGAVLNVNHSWSTADGLKRPKNGEERRVPLFPEVRTALPAQLESNPHKDVPESARFVSWGDSPDKPRYDG
jgi:hypothetical protein